MLVFSRYAVGEHRYEFPDGGKVAIIEGMSGNASGNARPDGFKDSGRELISIFERHYGREHSAAKCY